MQYKLPITLALSMLTFGSISTQAQTVATFDDVTLPGADTSFLEVLPAVDGIYPFETGNTKFYGKIDYGGSYQAQYNYSNRTDTVNPDYDNQWAAITGRGAELSANYGIAYTESDFSNFFQSTESGPKLTGDAAGHRVAGVYITNTTVAYRWIQENYGTGDWYKLTVRGYLNNVKTEDSVVITLASYTANDTTLVNNWQWVNLLPLGDVDSITFQTSSSDSYTPFYFALDNLTTLDGVCTPPQNIVAVNINENSATINWEEGIGGLTTNYEVAVDQSPTLAPTAVVAYPASSIYNATGLSNNTQYYAHVRAVCGNAQFSTWDTAAFKTLQGTGIFQTNANNLQISISPNPAADYLTLHTGIAVHAAVYSIEGKELLQINNAKKINISSLPSGIYLLKVADVAGTGKQTILRFTKN